MNEYLVHYVDLDGCTPRFEYIQAETLYDAAHGFQLHGYHVTRCEEVSRA